MIPSHLGVTLQVGDMERTAVDFLKSMRGREVRGTVVRDGAPGKVALLRIGGHLFEARVESGLLPKGASVFFRVERTGQHAFRLILLPGTPKQAGAVLPPGLPELLGRLLPQPGRTRDGPGRAVHREHFRELVRSLAEGSVPEGPQPLFGLWDEDSAGPEHHHVSGESEKGERHEGEQSTADESSQNSALLFLEPRAHRLTVRLDFPETGVVAVAIVWTAEAEGRTVFVRCERPETARLIQADARLWEAALQDSGFPLAGFQVLGPEASGGVEFRA